MTIYRPVRAVLGLRPVLAAVAVLALGVTGGPPAAASAQTPTDQNAVQAWDDVAGQVAVAACISPVGNPLHESRMYAMASLAVHDALNSIERRYRSYAFDSGEAPNASTEAAVAAAAHIVLVHAVEGLPDLFDGCRAAAVAVADDAFTTALDEVPDGPAEDAGVALGAAAAEMVIAVREDDGSDTPLVVDDFEQGSGPGEWRFTEGLPFAFAPGWAEVTPFALRGPAGFRAAPPYPLGSAAYARDFARVKALGGDGVTTPSDRSPDQTEVARFWLESSPLQWNRIARSVAAQRGLDEWQSARLFALLNMALADGYIASWAVKYDVQFWRPETAIREADHDGNPRTTADPTWTPLDPTAPVPDHDSAHAVQGAAAAVVMRTVFGTDAVTFGTCSLTLPDGQRCDDDDPTVRDYSGFWEAAEENAESRVLVGYHFGRAAEIGLDHGRQLAHLVMAGRLAPVGGPAHHHMPPAHHTPQARAL